MAIGMLLLRGLKEQGRLGRSFGSVTIRDQPPSNTIQKLIALKEAMTYMENYLQNVNVVLLKIRGVMLSVQPEVCDRNFHYLIFTGSATTLEYFSCIKVVIFN